MDPGRLHSTQENILNKHDGTLFCTCLQYSFEIDFLHDLIVTVAKTINKISGSWASLELIPELDKLDIDKNCEREFLLFLFLLCRSVMVFRNGAYLAGSEKVIITKTL